MFTSVNVFEHY